MKYIKSKSFKKLSYTFPEGYNWQRDLEDAELSSIRQNYWEKPGVNRLGQDNYHLIQQTNCSNPNRCKTYGKLQKHISELEKLSLTMHDILQNEEVMQYAAEDYLNKKFPNFAATDYGFKNDAIQKVAKIIKDGYAKTLRSISFCNTKYNYMLYAVQDTEAPDELDQKLEKIGLEAQKDDLLQKLIKIYRMHPHDTFDILPNMKQAIIDIFNELK